MVRGVTVQRALGRDIQMVISLTLRSFSEGDFETRKHESVI